MQHGASVFMYLVSSHVKQKLFFTALFCAETYDKTSNVVKGISESAAESRTGEDDDNGADEDPVVNCHCGVHRV